MSRVWRPRNSCRQSPASKPLLEHECRAHGGLRRDNGRVHEDRERDPSATKCRPQCAAVAHVKLQGGKARTLRGRDADAARRRMQIAHASERGEENVMVGWILRY